MDFYELTMAAGYFEEGYTDKVGVFDMFFRKIPDGGGFAIAAGLEQFCEVVDNLHFSEEDIEYLRGKGCFSEQFLDYLRRFEFHCNIWAVAEGTPFSPTSPSSSWRARPSRPNSSRRCFWSPSTIKA